MEDLGAERHLAGRSGVENDDEEDARRERSRDPLRNRS
jgi:hypothetical protein